MAIEKIIVSGRENVASWLNANASDFFASVTMDGYALVARDTQNNVVLNWDSSQVTIYKSTAVSDSLTVDTSMNGKYTIAKCSGGILIISGTSNTHHLNFIITKTNNDVTAVIAGGNYNLVTALTQSIIAAAWGDAEDATKTRTFTPSAQNQTQFVSFTTYAKPDTTSYTPNAFYLPDGQYYSLEYGKIIVNGKIYITNGYWAILDE